MRGTLNGDYARARLLRFIPAHAGNSVRARRPRSSSPVHPRACGELMNTASPLLSRSGSSPRMRGTRERSGWRRPQRTVHPRACGELSRPGLAESPSAGSSPRMRGTHYLFGGCPVLERFIPAHAGNSVRRPRSLPRPTVHPRACGELSSSRRYAQSSSGSSPRMRGTPPAPSPNRPTQRFIPAHAGNSRLLAS